MSLNAQEAWQPAQTGRDVLRDSRKLTQCALADISPGGPAHNELRFRDELLEDKPETVLMMLVRATPTQSGEHRGVCVQIQIAPQTESAPNTHARTPSLEALRLTSAPPPETAGRTHCLRARPPLPHCYSSRSSKH